VIRNTCWFLVIVAYSEAVAGEWCRCQPERLYRQHSTTSRSV